MTMNVTWKVDHYQLNVHANTVGDAAITLLVKDDPASVPTVQSAVLIDGGNGAKMVPVISTTLDHLNSVYPKFSLDRFVVSHWDAVGIPVATVSMV